MEVGTRNAEASDGSTAPSGPYHQSPWAGESIHVVLVLKS